jgi:hypothetical protein
MRPVAGKEGRDGPLQDQRSLTPGGVVAMTDEQLAALTGDQLAAILNAPEPPPGYEDFPGWRWSLFMRSCHVRRGLPRRVLDEPALRE